MKSYILTIGVNPSLDKTVTAEQISPGHENRATLTAAEAGGKAINVARALSRMKFSAHAALVVGTGGTGVFIRSSLEKESFGRSFYTIREDSRTNLTIRCGVTETRVLEQGPTLSTKESADTYKLCTDAMRQASAVVISGRTTSGLPDDFYARLITHALKSGIPTALDTSGSALKTGISSKPDIIKPNLKEAEELLGIRLSSPTKIVKALHALHEMGIASPIISAGKDGAYAFDGQNVVHAIPPRLTDIVTTVGCGDCFLAGFVAAKCAGKNVTESMREATSWAAANTQSNVHGGISPTLVKRLRPHVTVERL